MVCAVQGVRFNAEKQQVGSYFSTKIWNFGMKAPCCGERIEVQTDPKNHEYVIVRGARRKVPHCYLTACRVSPARLREVIMRALGEAVPLTSWLQSRLPVSCQYKKHSLYLFAFFPTLFYILLTSALQLRCVVLVAKLHTKSCCVST